MTVMACFGTDKWMKSPILGKVYSMFSEFAFQNLILGLNGWIKENIVFPNIFLETARLFWTNCKATDQKLVRFFPSFQLVYWVDGL